MRQKRRCSSREKRRSRSNDYYREKQRKKKRSREKNHDNLPNQQTFQKHKRKKQNKTEVEPEDVKNVASELTSKLNQNLYGSKDNIKNLSLMQKINPVNKSLGLGFTLVEGNSNFPLGNLNTSMFSMMTETNKIKRKIFLPKDNNFNFTGFLIGPKGNSQRQRQQRTGCKINVRGRGSHPQLNDNEDDQDLHVLILGDTQAQVAQASAEIERIIFADEETLNKMKYQQMSQCQQSISTEDNNINLAFTTPSGPPSENAYILEVPNECVGLVIGREGETIKSISKRSGAIKVQVATASAPDSKSRNIFVEGDYESVERVRKQLNTIVQSHKKMNSGALSGNHLIEVEVPYRLIGLVIGRRGQTIKSIITKTNAFISLKKDDFGVSKKNKTLVVTGREDLCLIAKYQIERVIQKGLLNLQTSGGGLTLEQSEMIKPLTPIAIQLAEANIPIPTQIQSIQEDPTTQYVLNKTLQNQIPTDQLFDNFLGPTTSIIEETVIEDEPKKKFMKKY